MPALRLQEPAMQEKDSQLLLPRSSSLQISLINQQTQFDIVRGGIDQSRDKTSVIKSSIEECNKVIINVNQLMINLSAISEENAASTTETADSMQVLNHTINNLLTESQKLLAASSDLEKDMQSFIL